MAVIGRSGFMTVAGNLFAHRNQMQARMTDAALGSQCIGEAADRVTGTLENGDLQAAVMAETDLGGGDTQFVMVMLMAGHPPGQIADIVIENIGKGGDAGRLACGRMMVRRRLAQQRAHGLGAIGISALAHQPVNRLQQGSVNGDGGPFYACLLSRNHDMRPPARPTRIKGGT